MHLLWNSDDPISRWIAVVNANLVHGKAYFATLFTHQHAFQMKYFFGLILWCFPLFLGSQTIYGATDFAGINESIRLSNAPLNFDTAQVIGTGPGHVWDYSLLPIATQSFDEYVDPNEAGYKLSWCFLNGTIFNCDQAFNDFVNRATPLLDFNLNGFVLEDAITHYNLTQNTFEEKFIGATVSFGESPIPATINLENVDTIYQFPFTYQKSDSSNRRFVADLSSFGINIRYSSTSKRVNTVVGWGELYTPFGAFDETLHMRTTITGKDSISLDTTIFMFDYQRVIHKWFDPNYPIPVLEISGVITDMGEVLNQVTFIDSARCLSPFAQFTTLPLAPALDSMTESVTINFTNLSTGYDSLYWDFGDGSFSTELNPSHTFTCRGLREITLIASNRVCNPIQSDTFSLVIVPNNNGTISAQNMVTEENHVLYASLDNVDYQWLSCENGFEAIPEATGSSYELPTTGGLFALAILTPNGCADTTNCTSYDSFVGTKTQVKSPFRIFPNPVEHVLIIENDQSVPIEFIELFTISGEKIRRFSTFENESFQVQMDVAAGLYLLKIVTKDQTFGHLVTKIE
jgi:hypothetical protein